MSTTVAIPRFLLPGRGAIWRTRVATPLQMRNASTKASKKNTSSSKPLVLEKPVKFVPPSHGSKLRKAAPRYPGPNLSAEEKARQQTKKYPNMMPPANSLAYRFLHSKSIHVYIALSTLFTLAATVFITNFKRTSPVADLLPHWTQLFVHPIRFVVACVDVLRLHQEQVSAETQARRTQKVEDVAKRSAYRKAHGLDQSTAFGGWTAKSDDQLLGPAITLGDGAVKGDEVVPAAQAAASSSSSSEQPETPAQQVQNEKRPIKKWLGIW